MSQPEYIHIVSSADANYSKPLCVMIYSVLASTSDSKRVFFHILDSGVTAEAKREIDRIAKHFSAPVAYIGVDPHTFNTLTLHDHLTSATYNRLLIPQFFSQYEKVLFLDSDIVCNKDVRELWSQDVSGFALAAVQDCGEFSFKQLGLPRREDYFNAGVMLVNVRFWEEHRVADKIRKFIAETKNDLFFCDQDILNAVLWRNWKHLSLKFNVQSSVFRNVFSRKSSIVKEAVIFHFSSPYKPWSGYCYHPAQRIYFEFLNKTKWAGERRQKKTFSQGVRFLSHRLIPFRVKMILRKIAVAYPALNPWKNKNST